MAPPVEREGKKLLCDDVTAEVAFTLQNCIETDSNSGACITSLNIWFPMVKCWELHTIAVGMLKSDAETEFGSSVTTIQHNMLR